MKIFVVKDMKAQAVTHQFFERTTADALRGFSMAANEQQSIIGKFPGDFRLLCVGELDTKTARIEQYADAQDLGSALDFVTGKPGLQVAQ